MTHSTFYNKLKFMLNQPYCNIWVTHVFVPGTNMTGDP